MIVSPAFLVTGRIQDIEPGVVFVPRDPAMGALCLRAAEDGDDYVLVLAAADDGALPRIYNLENYHSGIRPIASGLEVEPLPDDGFGTPHPGFQEGGLLHITPEGDAVVSFSAGPARGVGWYSLTTGMRVAHPRSDALMFKKWRIIWRREEDRRADAVELARYPRA